MPDYTLTFRPVAGPALVDGSALRPDALCALDPAALAAMPLPVGRRQVPLAELFDIEHHDSAEAAASAGARLRLRDVPPLNHLGAHMTRGELILEGDAGDDLGASMTGGLIRVCGGAGHRVGGPHPTSRRGMTGGEILIDGGCGDYCGFLMRGGLIAVAGNTGKSPGCRMLAGTIALGAGDGRSACIDHPGLEMQRGTILCLSPDATLRMGESFARGAAVDAGAMPALLVALKRLQSLGWPADAAGREQVNVKTLSRGRWNIHTGDRLELNKGEVLQWLSGT